MGEIKDKNVYTGELKEYQIKRIKEWLNDGNKIKISWVSPHGDKTRSEALKELKQRVKNDFSKANGIVKTFLNTHGRVHEISGIPVVLKEE
ncbi:MAG: hypothetical protein ACOCP8_08710 [archaeon]